MLRATCLLLPRITDRPDYRAGLRVLVCARCFTGCAGSRTRLHFRSPGSHIRLFCLRRAYFLRLPPPALLSSVVAYAVHAVCVCRFIRAATLRTTLRAARAAVVVRHLRMGGSASFYCAYLVSSRVTRLARLRFLARICLVALQLYAPFRVPRLLSNARPAPTCRMLPLPDLQLRLLSRSTALARFSTVIVLALPAARSGASAVCTVWFASRGSYARLPRVHNWLRRILDAGWTRR